jgi:hypothetical protein
MPLRTSTTTRFSKNPRLPSRVIPLSASQRTAAHSTGTGCRTRDRRRPALASSKGTHIRSLPARRAVQPAVVARSASTPAMRRLERVGVARFTSPAPQTPLRWVRATRLFGGRPNSSSNTDLVDSWAEARGHRGRGEILFRVRTCPRFCHPTSACMKGNHATRAPLGW